MLDNGSDVDKLLQDKHSEAGEHTEAASGPSGSGNTHFADVPPDLDLPSFEQSSADPVYNFDDRQFTIPDGGEEPPPEFEPYTAEYSISWSGDIISHDPHLNQDGEALYRFLLARAQEHPEYVLHCRGTHDEQRTHHETYTDSRGNRQTRLETRTETVTDFDFQIDVAQQFLPGALLWTAPDGEPTYRGGRTRTTKDGQVAASRAAIKALKKLQQYRANCGFPPWVGSSSTGEVDFDRQFEVLQSSWTLREWADDYCSSDKIFKEFIFEKMVYGWKSSLIIDAVRSAIKSTYYQGDIHVNFDKRLARVIIRRNTRVQRLLSSVWFKVLLWLTLIYPFVWLFQRFHPRGYGKWTVAGSAHALTRFYRHGPPPSDHSSEPSRAVVRPEGMRDGEWFRMWEGSIRRMAASRFRSSEAVMVPDGVGVVPNRPALSLDSHNALTYFGA